jgi:hypothetical protein
VVILAAASFKYVFYFSFLFMVSSKSPDLNPIVTARQMNESGIFIMTINFQPSEGTIIEGLRSISRPNMAFSSVNMETLGADLQYGLTTGFYIPMGSISSGSPDLHLRLQFTSVDRDPRLQGSIWVSI